MAENQTLSESVAIGQFRFALIAPVIQNLFPDESKTAYYKRIAENEFTLPSGKKTHYSYKTLEKWVSLYQNGGIDALMPKARSDKGQTRVLSDVAMEEIFRLKQEYPRLNATQIYHKLVADGLLTNKMGFSGQGKGTSPSCCITDPGPSRDEDR